MKQAQTTLEIGTQGPGLYEVTGPVAAWVDDRARALPLSTGMLTVYCRHTSASLTIQENADPDVQRDIETYFAGLAPRDPQRYRHSTEGPDDMPAHLRSALTDVSLSIPVGGGRPLLGTWQGIYLFEHRDRPHRRQVVLHLLGD